MRTCRNSSVEPKKRPESSSRALLACGSVAAPLFIAGYAAAGRRQMVHGYDPRRDPVSMIVRGPGGGAQTANFVVSGALLCASALGARRALAAEGASMIGTRSIPPAIGAVGVGLLGAGIFPTDIIEARAYEEGQDQGQKPTRTGALHVAFAVPVFTGMPIVCFIGARRFSATGFRKLSRMSLGVGVCSIAAATVSGRGFSEAGRPELSRLGRRGGTFQRVAVATGLGYVSAYLCRLLLRLSD
ncbi:MAG: DUF998 domain-containing protein [Acidimicrobiales bacterium]